MGPLHDVILHTTSSLLVCHTTMRLAAHAIYLHAIYLPVAVPVAALRLGILTLLSTIKPQLCLQFLRKSPLNILEVDLIFASDCHCRWKGILSDLAVDSGQNFAAVSPKPQVS